MLPSATSKVPKIGVRMLCAAESAMKAEIRLGNEPSKLGKAWREARQARQLFALHFGLSVVPEVTVDMLFDSLCRVHSNSEEAVFEMPLQFRASLHRMTSAERGLTTLRPGKYILHSDSCMQQVL